VADPAAAARPAEKWVGRPAAAAEEELREAEHLREAVELAAAADLAAADLAAVDPAVAVAPAEAVGVKAAEAAADRALDRKRLQPRTLPGLFCPCSPASTHSATNGIGSLAKA
jgi:hypothetical protein